MDRQRERVGTSLCGPVVALCLITLGLWGLGQAAEFTCAAGDVACLINAMNAANANGEENTITLAAGTYTLTAIGNGIEGPLAMGLPSVTSPLTLRGAGAASTIIERAANAPHFRLGYVASMGHLTLEGLTLRGSFSDFGGAALFNEGMLVLTWTMLTDNGGGGISNYGSLTLLNSTLARNYGAGASGASGGGLSNDGVATVINTTFVDNRTSGRFGGAGGGISNRGMLMLMNSTLTGNGPSAGGDGGGLYTSGGTAFILNSTLVRNRAGNGGGIDVVGGTVSLQNTLLALNTTTEQALGGPDCLGPVTSLGHNLIGDPSGCTIALQDSDLTGDPGLGAFTEGDTPGRGHVPLLPESPAIDAGNDAVCPDTDQLGQPRVKVNPTLLAICDIGAVEFQPPGMDVVAIRQAIFVDQFVLLFVVATSSAAPDAALFVTVPGCFSQGLMSRVKARYFLVRTVPECGDLVGRMVTVTSSHGGSASAPLR